MPDYDAALVALKSMTDIVSSATTQLTIGEVTRTYKDQLTNFVFEALNGNMDALDLSRSMRSLLRDLADDVYIEGMREGGIKDPESELDKDDESAIKDWLSGQLSHVRDFSRAVISVRSGDTTRRDILDRIELWVDNLALLGSLGTASAKRNIMVTWVYGDTDHCATCKMLNGKRRRLKWFIDNGYIPQERGSATLDCGGWECGCHLEDDEGNWIMPVA